MSWFFPNSRPRLKALTVLGIVCAGFLLTQNCGNINLSPAVSVAVMASSTGQFCSEAPEKFGQYTKIMFVVDMSGSNLNGPNNNGVGTDPQKDRRGKAIEKFLAKHRTNAYVEWGFVVFNGTAAESYIPDQGGPNLIFTGDVGLMDAAITRFRSTPDVNGTPYKAAMGVVRSAVVADQRKDPKITSNYEIIFLSDGYPTDYGKPVIDTATIYADVDDLVGTSTGRVHLSTVYYGPIDPTAQDILKNMAEHGFGKFQDTNVGPEIDIDGLLAGGISNEPYIIKRLVVYNLNAGMCSDGSVGPDSDADGICDKDEEAYNQKYASSVLMKGKVFSSTNRNSFSSQFSDFYYLKYIQGQALPACSEVSDEDFDLASFCEEKFIVNASPQGPTVDWTNEMTKAAHEGDPKYFDSDGDGILDGLETLYFKNKSSALNYNNIFEKVNSLDNNYLFINHLNPLNPNSSLAYGPQITQVENNDLGQNCYSYSQENLPLYPVKAVAANQVGGNTNLVHAQDENIVLVYFIQVPENAPNAKGILRYSYQKLKVGVDGPKSIQLTPAIYSIYPKH